MRFSPTILKFYKFDNLSRNMADDWQSPNSRQNVVAKITEFIQASGLGPSKYACTLENHIYEKAGTKQEYLDLVFEMFRKLKEKITCDPAGKPQQPPNADLDNANVMQDPLNALQTLSSQGNRNAQMMPMRSDQPNQMPPGAVVGVNVAASNLLQTKRDSQKFELASVITDDWPSRKFRQNVVANITKVLQLFVLDPSKGVCMIENDIYKKVDTKKKYLERLSNSLKFLTKMINRDPAGNPQQPPNVDLDNANVMQDPLNALQTLSSQGNRNAQMMPMGSDQPNQMPPGAVVGVNVAASNLLQTKRNFWKFELASVITDDWQSRKLRQNVVAKITKVLQPFVLDPWISICMLENDIYKKVDTKEKYLEQLAEALRFLTKMINRDPAGKPQQPPNVDLDNANVMQDPLNALQTLSSQDNRNAQMMPMRSDQPNQMPPGAVVGVNVAASNLLQTKRDFWKFELASVITDDWQSRKLRQNVVAKITKVLQPFVLDPSKSVCNIENDIYKKADTKEKYLEQLAKMLRFLSKMINRSLAGKQQQPPNADMDSPKLKLSQLLADDCQSPKFRRKVVAKITKLIECSGSNASKDAGIMENNIYKLVRTKEEYLGLVDNLSDPPGKPQQPPNVDLDNANVMQDPLNELQPLLSQGNRNAQMMPMGSGQPNQMPPSAVVGVNVAASNRLQTKRELSSADCSENINNGIAKKRRRQETNSEAEYIEGDGENAVEQPPWPKVKAEAAIQALSISIQWAEENSASLDTILTLKNLRESAVEKNFASKDPTKNFTI